MAGGGRPAPGAVGRGARAQGPGPIPFNLTRPQYLELRAEIDAAAGGAGRPWFVLGRQGTAFEQEFAAYLGAGHAVGVGWHVAIHLALWALGVGQGDEVLTVAHTAVATARGDRAHGGDPVFVDVDPLTYTLDPGAAGGAPHPAHEGDRPGAPLRAPGRDGAHPGLRRRRGCRWWRTAPRPTGRATGGACAGRWDSSPRSASTPPRTWGPTATGAVVTGDGALAERVRRLRSTAGRPSSAT